MAGRDVIKAADTFILGNRRRGPSLFPNALPTRHRAHFNTRTYKNLNATLMALMER